MAEYDVVIVGGGHNGLVCAAYLARAGLSVCVVEQTKTVGGAAQSAEVTLPGFKHDPGAIMHFNIIANPLIHRDELGLISKYGLRYVNVNEEPCVTVIFPDERALTVYRDMKKTCESIAQFSQRDAEVYPRFCEASRSIVTAGGVANFRPIPPFGRLVGFMDSSPEGREYLRVILSSTIDIASEWFESEQMKLLLARFASEVMIGPRENGTGALMFGVPAFHRWGVAFPEGGSGRLTDALAACLKDNGGTIKTSSPVKRIKVEGGEAKGVILDTGEEIRAKKFVVSAVNIKQLALQMLASEELPPGFPDRVRNLRHSSFSGLMQAIALKEAPRYKVGGDANRTVLVELCPFLEDFLRDFDDYNYGVPTARTPLVGVVTLLDPTRAPEGKHTLYLWQYNPYELKDGGAARWDEIKQEVADRVLETLRRHATNMGPENILGRWIASPLDLERYFPSLIHGDVMHVGQFLSQWFSNRPLAGWGGYKTPVKKLYMCGASTHPGGSVSGGARACIQVIFEDLGIDFAKVIAK